MQLRPRKRKPSTLTVSPRLIMRGISAFFAFAVIWLIGFCIFAVTVLNMTPERPDTRTDLIVVLTGGSNRVDTGLNLILANKARAMLITGVHPDAKFQDLVRAWNAGPDEKLAIMGHCCITLDTRARTTEENAFEIGRWVMNSTSPNLNSIRVVTSNYHMPRSMLLIARGLPNIKLVTHPVEPTDVGMTEFAFWRNTLIEYHKFIFTWLYTRIG